MRSLVRLFGIVGKGTYCSHSVETLASPSRRSLFGRVGFVGLGNMGSSMATNLASSGYDVLVYDVDPLKISALVSSSRASPASSLQEVAESCSSIVTMLPNTPHAKAVYLGTQGKGGVGGTGQGKVEGLLSWTRPGTILIDSSTIDPLASRQINASATAKGAVMLDAPVSGGVTAAAGATLTFIVGGSTEGLETSRPLLEAMGNNVVHCGEVGAGCVAKICNNLSLAISMIGVCEAMNLGTAMGMDPKVLASVLNSSTARCWSSDSYNPCPGVMEGVPSSKGFEGGFAAVLMEKDLHLALQAGRESSKSLPMGALAHQLYSLMCGHGSGRKDFSGIYEIIAGKKNILSEGREDTDQGTER